MADPPDQGGTRPLGEIEQGGIAGLPIEPGQAHLDELVVVQCPFGFADHSRRDTGISDQNHGLEGVGEAAQVASLFFGKLHAPIVDRSGANYRCRILS